MGDGAYTLVSAARDLCLSIVKLWPITCQPCSEGLLAAILAASVKSAAVPFLTTRKKSLKSSYWRGLMFWRALR